MKYILVTGGILSGLGKGTISSSIGVLLKACGWRVTAIKLDPYLNVDARTTDSRGEVFVLNDGGEADFDLGNYERFLDINLRSDSNLTTGKIYQSVIERERRGEYLGKTVQVVPHITDAIQQWIKSTAKLPVDSLDQEADICLIELAGTIGDIDCMPFVEALRQMLYTEGNDNFCTLHVSLLPSMGADGEAKTKPIQHSIKQLRSAGFMPDVIICRSDKDLDKETFSKLALFCQVPIENVLSLHDVREVYTVPEMLEKQKVVQVLTDKLKMYLPNGMPKMDLWSSLVRRIEGMRKVVDVGIFTEQRGLGEDSCVSIVRATQHAGFLVGCRVRIHWLLLSTLDAPTASEVNAEAAEALLACAGLILPGNLKSHHAAQRNALTIAREKKLPLIAIGSGLHAMVAEVCTSLGGWTATEAALDHEPAAAAAAARDRTLLAAAAEADYANCIGSQTSLIISGESKLAELYKSTWYRSTTPVTPDSRPSLPRRGGAFEMPIAERHRNRKFISAHAQAAIEACGAAVVAHSARNATQVGVDAPPLVHAVELTSLPFFVGLQFHPEFNSRPFVPAPTFVGLMQAAAERQQQLPQSSKDIESPVRKRLAGSTASGGGAE